MQRALAAIVLLCCVASLRAQPVTPETQAFANFTREWRDDAAWKDTEEVAVYDVIQEIDGKKRESRVTVTTHKELADPVTKTRSATNEGREVFKQLSRGNAPTDSGEEHATTMVYVGTSDLKSLRIDVGVQNATGVSFKWFANHKGTLEWHQFSYHPGEGHKTGSFTPPESFVFGDALPLVLRGYPFEKAVGKGVFSARVLGSQTSSHITSDSAGMAFISFHGKETLDLPIGKVEAYRLELAFPSIVDSVEPPSRFWFATDPKFLRVMVQFQGPYGPTCKLRSLERKAQEQPKADQEAGSPSASQPTAR
jgi:hypothetical protein